MIGDSDPRDRIVAVGISVWGYVVATLQKSRRFVNLLVVPNVSIYGAGIDTLPSRAL